MTLATADKISLLSCLTPEALGSDADDDADAHVAVRENKRGRRRGFHPHPSCPFSSGQGKI